VDYLAKHFFGEAVEIPQSGLLRGGYYWWTECSLMYLEDFLHQKQDSVACSLTFAERRAVRLWCHDAAFVVRPLECEQRIWYASGADCSLHPVNLDVCWWWTFSK
jgi:hypothetical protein